MTFFSTSELLEIGGHPMALARPKPVREEALVYYRKVAAAERLDLATYERVARIVPPDQRAPTEPGFRLETERATGPGVRHARAVVVATGYHDAPNRLGVPGEDLPHVSHWYDEGHSSFGRRVIVVGGQGSAAEAALDLNRCGAEVTLVHRGPALGPSVKYWIRPDLENRIREGSIAARFSARVVRIEAGSVRVHALDGESELPADRVYLLTGYTPDTHLLEEAGVAVDAATRRPALHPASHETNVPGIYVAGSAGAGRDAGGVFIENARVHADEIATAIAGAR